MCVELFMLDVFDRGHQRWVRYPAAPWEDVVATMARFVCRGYARGEVRILDNNGQEVLGEGETKEDLEVPQACLSRAR